MGSAWSDQSALTHLVGCHDSSLGAPRQASAAMPEEPVGSLAEIFLIKVRRLMGAGNGLRIGWWAK